MVKYYDEIPDFVVPWINEQKIFWVATAPLTANGHVNVSPKGIFDGNFNVVDSHRVWYEDLTGSGIETVSHLRENGRITIMFTAFEGPPRICRLFGKGKVYEYDTPEYNALLSPQKRQPGSRAIIVVDVYQVSTSCGYSIPFFSFVGYRLKLHSWLVSLQNNDSAAEEQAFASCDSGVPAIPASETGLKYYWKNRNMKSLDGLPGLGSAYASQARFVHTDPKSIVWHETRPANSSSMPTWINSQTVAAFTLGAVASATLLKVLHQQR